MLKVKRQFLQQVLGSDNDFTVNIGCLRLCLSFCL